MPPATKPNRTGFTTRGRPLVEWRPSAPAGSPLRVDREHRVIEGVRVLGRYSRNSHGLKEAGNGTEYTPECMREALPLYEGAEVLSGHEQPGRQRANGGNDDAVGVLRNARVEGDPGQECVRADLHYFESHPITARVLEDVERGLGVFGLSHDARAGKERFDPGSRRLVIESLSAVHSVDLVRKPASNRNLWESVPMSITLRELLEKLKLTPARGAWRKRLLEEDGMPGMDAAVDAPADLPADPAPADADEALTAGFKSAMMAVIDDGSLDAAGKLAKLKQLLTTHEKLTTEAEPEAPPADGGTGGSGAADDAKTESQKELAKLRHQLAVRKLADDLGVKGDKVLLETAEALPTVEAARKLLEREKARGGSAAPKGGAPRTGGAGAVPTDRKDFAASIKD